MSLAREFHSLYPHLFMRTEQANKEKCELKRMSKTSNMNVNPLYSVQHGICPSATENNQINKMNREILQEYAKMFCYMFLSETFFFFFFFFTVSVSTSTSFRYYIGLHFSYSKWHKNKVINDNIIQFFFTFIPGPSNGNGNPPSTLFTNIKSINTCTKIVHYRP